MLHYDQYVVTEIGPMKIGRLHHRFTIYQDAPRVLSYNHFDGKFEYKPIMNAISKPCDIIVLVSHNKGYFMCTKMKKILTVDNYKPAMALKEDEVITGHGNGNERFLTVSGVNNITNDFVYVYDIEIQLNYTYVLHNGPIVYGYKT